MADYQNLSKEELIALIQASGKQDVQTESVAVEETKTVPVHTRCQFVPSRKGGAGCDKEPMTLWGFCQKHSKTIQSREAEVEYRVQQASERPKTVQTSIVEYPAPVETPPVETSPVVQTVVEPVAPPEPVVQTVVEPVVQTVVEPVVQEETPPEPVVQTVAEPVVEESDSDDDEEYQREVEEIKRRSVIRKQRLEKKKKNKLVLRKNYWGRFEDMETGILFDPKQRKAYGVQNRTTGQALTLTPYHINICEERGWPYMVVQSQDSEEEESEEDEYVSTEEESDEESDEEESDEESDEEDESEEEESDEEESDDDEYDESSE